MKATAVLRKKRAPRKSRPLPLPLLLLLIGILALSSLWVLFRHMEHAQTRHEHLSPSKASLSQPELLPSSVNQDDGEKATAVTSIMKIPAPVFVTSLPKSGTTSTWKYFLCGLGKGRAAHQWASVNNGTEQVRLGKCFKDNMKHNRPLLEGCGDYLVWTDTGLLAPGTCFYPSIHGGLQALYDSYPTATILQVNRDTESWVNSTTEFNDLWSRWSDKCDKFPGAGSKRDDYTKFYDWHTEMVRQFAKDHPSLNYIEVSLEGLDTGRILEDATGIDASCWVHSRTKKGKRARPYLKKRKEQDMNK